MQKRRAITATLLSLALLPLALLLSLALDIRIENGERIVTWLFPWADTTDSYILVNLRLPRVLAAAVVGAGLATAGCTFQAVLRNPLAEPYTLGVSSGAALFAVLAIRFHLDAMVGPGAVGAASLIGATATIWLVWRLGQVAGQLPTATLLLAGITIAMFSSAASMAVQYTSDFSEVYRMLRWMMGGLESVSYRALIQTSIGVVVGLIVLFSLSSALNAISAGSDAAAAVGFDPKHTTTVAFVCSSLLVGATIALAGPIGFVGLFVPHALRPLVGPNHKVLLPLSALFGAVLLVLCDMLAREILAPDQLPVGIITALFGGPFFLFLLLKQKAHGRFWIS